MKGKLVRKLSITTAWNETAVFVAREAQLVLPIGFLLMALPGALLQIIMPVPTPGQLPEAGPWLAAVPAAILISLVGTLAVTLLALRPGTSVGEALQHGARRLLPVALALLLVSLGAAIATLPVFLLFGLLAMAAGTPAVGAFALIVIFPLMLVLWARLSMVAPVAAMEPVGPIAILQRSWALTRGHFGKLLGFLALMVLVMLVISIAVSAIGGILIFLIAGPPAPGSLAFYLMLIVSALVQTVLSTVFAVLVARVYAQLAGDGQARVSA